MGDLLMIVNEGSNSIAINIDTIGYIEETGKGCIIYLTNGSVIPINHSFNEVVGIFHSPYPYESEKNVFIQRNMIK